MGKQVAWLSLKHQTLKVTFSSLFIGLDQKLPGSWLLISHNAKLFLDAETNPLQQHFEINVLHLAHGRRIVQ